MKIQPRNCSANVAAAFGWLQPGKVATSATHKGLRGYEKNMYAKHIKNQ